ncbi:MAG: PEP-CTERM sorting domain-containing protein [Nitrosomonadales bacterium]|nr:PEP-CTERM sorting domain-containing protein [Nitrosomonadales bacterium]
MNTDNQFKKSLIGAALATALLTIPMAASATQFQVTITGTGAFSGISYDSGILSTNLISAGPLFSGPDFTYDISVNNSPGTSNYAFLDSTFGAYDNSSTAGTITIMASATDYTSVLADSYTQLFSSIGGTTVNATVNADAWVNNSNILMGMGPNVTTLGPFSSSSFSGDVSNSFIASNPFSITQRIVLSVGAHGSTTGDFMTKVPEPGSLALIGLGLLAAGALRRRQV